MDNNTRKKSKVLLKVKLAILVKVVNRGRLKKALDGINYLGVQPWELHDKEVIVKRLATPASKLSGDSVVKLMKTMSGLIF